MVRTGPAQGAHNRSVVAQALRERGVDIARAVMILVIAAACRVEPVPCSGTDCPGGHGIDTAILDADGDGWSTSEDCDDSDATINPDATEVPYDGIDQDCDGADLADVDGDGYSPTDDCDDGEASVHPDATEVPYDGIDQDCDGADIIDADGDGYATGEDCDDQDAAVSPAASEVLGNALDDDCDDEVDEILVCPEVGDFSTIQEAVDAAPQGGLVEICPATYVESVMLPDKSLTIVGTGSQPSDVVVDAGGAETALWAEISGDGALTVENLALTGSSLFAANLSCPGTRGSLALADVEVFDLTDGTALLIGCYTISAERVEVREGVNPDSSPAWPYVYFQGYGGEVTVTQMTIRDVITESASSCLLVVDGDPVSVTNTTLARSIASFCGLLVGYSPALGIEVANNTVVDVETTYQDDSSAIYLQGINPASSRNLHVVNNIITSSSVDWAFRLNWDWCTLDIAELALDDVLRYNLLYENSGGSVLNPANNDASDCTYWEYVSGCTCRDYGSDAVERYYWPSSNFEADPIFADEGYHLTPGSPAVDGGDPDTAYDDPDGSRSDIGAYGGPGGGLW